MISPEYKAQLQAVHAVDTTWGTTARKWSHHVQSWADQNKWKTVLDYGAGKGMLGRLLQGLDVREYDPGIPGKDHYPSPADLVVSLDVLEHIEPDQLLKVLAHIDSVALKGIYFNVALYPAGTWLPDGRNAHLIVERPQWWEATLRSAFVNFTLDFVNHIRLTRNGKQKDSLIIRGKRKV